MSNSDVAAPVALASPRSIGLSAWGGRASETYSSATWTTRRRSSRRSRSSAWFRPALDRWLGKIIAVERTFAVDPVTFQAQVQEEAARFVDRLVGRSFHVRGERRGHKGVIATHACEQALGAFLWAALEDRGARPVVEFRDPDVVLVVELVGDTAGLALVTRELCTRFPFVKID